MQCSVTVIHVSLYLRQGEDDDLLAFFSNIPPRCRPIALKSALRMGGVQIKTSPSAVVEDELIDAVGDLLFG